MPGAGADDPAAELRVAGETAVEVAQPDAQAAGVPGVAAVPPIGLAPAVDAVTAGETGPPASRRPPRPVLQFVVPAAGGSLLVLLWGATLLGRHSLAPSASVAAATLVLPWLYLLLATASVAMLAWRGVRRAALALLVLVGTTSALLWGGTILPRRAEPEGPSLRLVSWNLGRLGELAPPAERPAAEADALRCVAGAFQREAPDVAVLLEVSRRRLADLSSELDLDCQTTDYFNTKNPWHGGLAVCVARSSAWRPTGLSRMLALPPDWHYVFDELQGPGGTVNVLAVHFRPYGITAAEVARGAADLSTGRWRRAADLAAEAERAVGAQGQQVGQLLQAIGTFHDPTVLAGDLNGTPDFAVHVALRRELVDTWRRAGFGPGPTRWVGGWLPLRIDYVYASRRLPPREARLLPDRCSDHRAVAVTLSVRPPG